MRHGRSPVALLGRALRGFFVGMLLRYLVGGSALMLLAWLTRRLGWPIDLGGGPRGAVYVAWLFSMPAAGLAAAAFAFWRGYHRDDPPPG